jgi:cell division septation protein DedD
MELAALKNPIDPVAPGQRLGVGPASKQLEGFIVQVAFADKEKAQRWAESMERRGYAVSLTQAGGEGSLRVRLGNFAGRDEAERQLRSFQQEGLKGIVIRLPQAFRPTARTSVP